MAVVEAMFSYCCGFVQCKVFLESDFQKSFGLTYVHVGGVNITRDVVYTPTLSIFGGSV